LIYALLLPWNTPLHLALSCAAISIFSQLYLKPLTTFLFPALFCKCSLATLFLYGSEMLTVILVLQCCHCYFNVSECAQASLIFFSAGTVLVHDQFSSITPGCRFYLAGWCTFTVFFVNIVDEYFFYMINYPSELNYRKMLL